jgi:hypothetical protein
VLSIPIVIYLNQRERIKSCDVDSHELSEVSEDSDTSEEVSNKKLPPVEQQEKVHNLTMMIQHIPKKIIVRKKKRMKLNKNQIRLKNQLISSKLKFDISRSK